MDEVKDLEFLIDSAIHDWLSDRIAGSPVAQSTPAWNHLYESLPALRDRIKAAVKED